MPLSRARLRNNYPPAGNLLLFPDARPTQNSLLPPDDDPPPQPAAPDLTGGQVITFPAPPDTPPATSVAHRFAAATSLRVSVADIQALPFDLSALEQEGIFLSVEATGFGSLDKQLDWRSLGVELPAQVSVALRAPHIGVLPHHYSKALKRAASQAYAALHKYGYRFTLTETLWGTSEYRWVPATAWAAFEEQYQAAQATLRQARQAVLDNYDDILVTLRQDFTTLAQDAARRLRATTDTPLPDTLADEIVARALALVPTERAVAEDLRLTLKPRVILLGSEMQAEQRRAAQERLQTAQATQQQRLLDQAAAAQERHLQRVAATQQAELAEEQAARARLRQLKVEAAREQFRETLSPFTEGLQHLHAKVYEAAQDMADKLAEARFVPGVTAKRARELCHWFRLMNFANDGELAELLARLEGLAAQGQPQRSPAEMRAALAAIAEAATQRSQAATTPTRLAALEL